MSILQTSDLRKYYGTEPNITRALDGVNFSVEEGEFVAVVGTSGSGKSTLLHMMGGLDNPTSGSVVVRGKELAKMSKEQLTIFRRRNIGFVLAAAGAYSLYNWFLLHNVASLVLSILCLLLIVVVWVIPELGLRHQARRMADGKEFALEVFPDAITVEHNGSEWEIPLDGEATDSAQYGNLLVLFHQKKMVILPLRCVEPAVLPEIQAMIVAGTNPRDDD